MRHAMFYIQLCIIIIVSVFDVFYTLLTKETILTTEQNPMAKWVITNYGVDQFVAIKTATTCLVVIILQWAYYNVKIKYVKTMWVVLGTIAIFQLALFTYLLTPPIVWIDMLGL